MQCSMWDLSSPGTEPMAPAVEVWSLNHWTPREFLFAPFSDDSSPHGTKVVPFKSVQLLSHIWLFATPWTAACQASLSFTISQSLLRLKFIELMMPSNHLILCCPLLLQPLIFPTIRVFSSELAVHIRWPKYWNFSFSLSPSSEYSGLISFKMDWLHLLAAKGLSRVFSSTTIRKHQPWRNLVSPGCF